MGRLVYSRTLQELRERAVQQLERAKTSAQGFRLDDLTAEWFPEQRAFFDDPAQLVAAVCGRRAGKTRGGCRHFIRQALTIPSARLLYLNSTRGEAERLAWYGNRNDGMAALCDHYKLKVKKDQSKLTLHFPETDSWIYLRGADDEAELRKALGGAYHEAWWDEAQKIPPKLAEPIREVFMPALLDYGGRLRFTGTTTRQMSGLFFEISNPDLRARRPGWSLHHWTLLDNPFFGATRDERYQRGIIGVPGMMGLQGLYGGPEAAPLDSPIIQREAFGLWVREDSAFVYHVHKVKADDLLYAPARKRADGFPDLALALLDLPFDWREATFGLGADLGYYPDPFTFVLWAWHRHDKRLYEVASWSKNYLDTNQQVAALREVREVVPLGLLVADASGAGKASVVGWSKEWVDRYGLPILEAKKPEKYTAIDMLNTDIKTGALALRRDGALYEEMSRLQWSSVITGSGKMQEDPTMANDVCDAALYSHRHAYQFRWRPDEVKPPPGSRERYAKEEAELARAMLRR